MSTDTGTPAHCDLGAGETTCAGYPASLEHEDTDAETFAEWGIDCRYSPGHITVEVLTQDRSQIRQLWCPLQLD